MIEGNMDFTYRLADALEAARRGQTATALACLEGLEQELACAAAAEPRWAARCRCHRLRQLFRLNRVEEALVLLEDPASPSLEADACLGANTLLQAAERAAGLGRSGQAGTLLLGALRLRCMDRDIPGVVGVVHAAFGLLGPGGDRVLQGLQQLSLSEPAGNGSALTAALAAARVADARWLPQPLPGGPAAGQPQVDLYQGAETGDISMVYRALAQGADPNRRNLRRPGLPTALMAAAFRGHTAVVQQLLDAGARTDSPNCLGLTARQLAEDQGQQAAAALLSAPCDHADRPRSAHSPGPRREAPGPSLPEAP